MPVAPRSVPYRKSRRLRNTDPKSYDQDDGLWETYDEALLNQLNQAPYTIKSEPDDTQLTFDTVVPEPAGSGHIPRPRNAFICFRSDYVRAEKRVAAHPKALDQTVMSRGAADEWRNMDENERLPYILMARAEKEAHTIRYPNYRYAPGSANGAARKKKTRRESPLAAGSESQSNVVRSLRKSIPSPSRKHTSRPRQTSSPSGAVAERVVEDVLVSAPACAPSPAAEAGPGVKKDNTEPQISRSATSSIHRKPTQFGFKANLSPTLMNSLALPAPSRSPSPVPFVPVAAATSLADLAATYLRRSPSPTPAPAPTPKPWDDWMYAPLELSEDLELSDFDAPPPDFGFFHEWTVDDLMDGPADTTISNDAFFTS